MKQHPFFKVRSDFLRLARARAATVDPELTTAAECAACVLDVFDGCAAKGPQFRISHNEITRRLLGMYSRPTVERAVRFLRSIEYIKIIRPPGGHSEGLANLYELQSAKIANDISNLPRLKKQPTIPRRKRPDAQQPR